MNNKINLYMDDRRTPRIGGWDEDGDETAVDPQWVVTRTIKDTKVLLSAGVVNNLTLDHDMGEGDTGYDLVKWMEETNTWPSGEITIHSANPVGRDNMLAVLARHKVSSICESCEHNNNGEPNV